MLIRLDEFSQDKVDMVALQNNIRLALQQSFPRFPHRVVTGHDDGTAGKIFLETVDRLPVKLHDRRGAFKYHNVRFPRDQIFIPLVERFQLCVTIVPIDVKPQVPEPGCRLGMDDWHPGSSSIVASRGSTRPCSSAS